MTNKIVPKGKNKNNMAYRKQMCNDDSVPGYIESDSHKQKEN